MFVRRADFAIHASNDEKQFEAIIKSLEKHDKNVNEKHQENRLESEKQTAAIAGVQATVNDLVALRPAIEAGLLADKEADYRKKLFKRVVLALITGGATVGGLIPLVQWLATIHIHFGD